MQLRLRSLAILATAIGVFAVPASASPVSGPGFNAAGEGRAMLDMLEGKAAAAAVSTSLYDAVMAAREAAWQDGQRLIAVPATLKLHAMAPGKSGASALVTLGEPSPEVAALLPRN